MWSQDTSGTTIQIQAKKTAKTAGADTISAEDRADLPIQNAGDLLHTVPGIHIVQHTGGAKAHQIFLRGYDAEHGLDVALFLAGIPLNETSHVHGHGYLDLHFIIPETIGDIEVTKGPYRAAYGNFSGAGAINFVPTAATGRQFIQAGGDSLPSADALLYYEIERGEQRPALVAGQVDHSAGYTQPGQQSAGRTFLSLPLALPLIGQWEWIQATYAATSRAADVIPHQEQFPRYEAVDPTGKIQAARLVSGLVWTLNRKNTQLKSILYHNYKQTAIYNNFTYYLNSPFLSDQVGQTDHRNYAGLRSDYRTGYQALGLPWVSEAGLFFRADFIEQAVHNTFRRRSWNQVNEFNIVERNTAVFAQQTLAINPFTLSVGLRYERFDYSGRGTQDTYQRDLVTNIPTRIQDQAIDFSNAAHALLPKSTITWHIKNTWQLFLSYGQTGISNDARSQALNPRGDIPLVQAMELGQSLRWQHSQLQMAVWVSDKEQEYIFAPQTGSQITRGAAQRFGADLDLSWATSGWRAGAGLYIVHARFTQSGRPIPGVPGLLLSHFLVRHFDAHWTASVRGRFLGPRPLALGREAEAYYVADVLISRATKTWEVALTVENLTAANWDDSVYAYRSRPQPGNDQPVFKGIHYTPGQPLTFRLALTYFINSENAKYHQ